MKSQKVEIDEINVERIDLLVKKYFDGSLIRSDKGSLDDLIAEIRDLILNISEEDIISMNRLSEKAAEFALFNEKMRKKLDMDY